MQNDEKKCETIQNIETLWQILTYSCIKYYCLQKGHGVLSPQPWVISMNGENSTGVIQFHLHLETHMNMNMKRCIHAVLGGCPHSPVKGLVTSL